MLKSLLKQTTFCLLLAASSSVAFAQPEGSEIVHDAEYYILEAQNGERWDGEDAAIDAKLASHVAVDLDV